MKRFKVKLLSTAVLLATSAMAMASDDIASLQQQIDGLKKEIAAGNNNFHLAGYSKLEYQSVDKGDDGFNKASFSPIFMYQMNDKLSFEAELNISTGKEGDSDLEMEYAYANIALTDDMTLIAGKFFIPVGNFVQNIHPSWINKAVSAPVGFGHGGAAPTSEVGLQLRGGSYLGEVPVNYAVYFGNGSKVPAGHGLEVTSVGMTKSWTGSNNVGGRVGFMPLTNLEVGFSFMTGKAAKLEVITHDDGDKETITGQKLDLDIFGADFVYRRGGLVVRGEYLKQELGDFEFSHEGETEIEIDSNNSWTTWYAQGAYRFSQSNWEAVLRYGNLESPVNEKNTLQDLNQLVVGVNYYFSPSILVKFNYETQDHDTPSKDKDIILAQLTYGF